MSGERQRFQRESGMFRLARAEYAEGRSLSTTRILEGVSSLTLLEPHSIRSVLAARMTRDDLDAIDGSLQRLFTPALGIVADNDELGGKSAGRCFVSAEGCEKDKKEAAPSKRKRP